ncbi:MAG: CRISPR system precrRNA processing endoribonuclease RAMP protein Cas6 [Caldimonas manganoxidans]|nr:CRISPR system precrRNA processing endoribonuclease RAMP protein Cas6 [Caldimonas manganoxidans]
MNLPSPFPVQRWRVHAHVTRTVCWPEYEGSALRGVWGHALRRLACATGQPRCEGCQLQRRCPYIALFEPAPAPGSRTYGDMTPPYVIEPGQGPRVLQAGQTYHFDLVVFGASLQYPALIRQAWQRALSANIGPVRGAMQLRGMELVQSAAPLPERPAPSRVWVQLQTPVYIKRDGRALRAGQLTAADFVWAVVRRVAEVCELHLQRSLNCDFKALKQAAAALHFAQGQWEDHHFERWSNRQGRNTPLQGILGRGLLVGDLTPFWPLLHLGQWLHAGGKASFGMGRYVLLENDT